MSDQRNATITRKTNETKIDLILTIDGSGKNEIVTGVPFLDHMLTLLAVHGFFDLTVKAKGDTDIDDHHTVEDIGICLGQALKNSLPNFQGICRYGHFSLPMDETLARVSLDFSNRPFLHYDVVAMDAKTGTFDTTLVEEFLRALAFNAGLTLHVEVKYGQNTHHIIEAIFKALGHALDQASSHDHRIQTSLSSKGTL